MKRVKTFSTHKSPSEAEAAVNEWLTASQGIEILSLTPTEDGGRYTITVFYADKTGSTGQRDERNNLSASVDYVVEDRHFSDFVKDLSKSGVFILTSRAFSVGQEITLTFKPPGTDRPLNINGAIVRVLPEGIGVKFKIESGVQDTVIKSFVEKVAGGA